MEFAALFCWIGLCLLLGGLLHFVMRGALGHRGVLALAAPGMAVRKLSMTLVALVFGGTVTRVRIYEISSRDIDFQADGPSSVAKVLAPLGPLFGCTLVLAALNRAFGRPLDLSYTVPALSSVDGAGIQGFLAATWGMLSHVVRQGLAADWSSPRLYLLFALAFSMALGACEPLERVKQAILGAALLSVALAVLSTVAVRRGGFIAASPPWFTTASSFVLAYAAVAFAMTVYGLMAALIVGLGVRIYEVASRLGGSSSTAKRGRKRRSSSRNEEVDLAA
jgi:hypothetical protein